VTSRLTMHTFTIMAFFSVFFPICFAHFFVHVNMQQEFSCSLRNAPIVGSYSVQKGD